MSKRSRWAANAAVVTAVLGLGSAPDRALATELLILRAIFP